MSCKAAYATDEWHGWGCEVTGGACVYLTPNSKRCAEEYGEGPDAYQEKTAPDAANIESGKKESCS